MEDWNTGIVNGTVRQIRFHSSISPFFQHSNLPTFQSSALLDQSPIDSFVALR